MPELPEVETIVRGLKRPLTGRRVTHARLRFKSLYRRGSLRIRAIEGRTIQIVDRIGKNALLRFRPSGLMVVNLGMTGNLIVHDPHDTAARLPTRHLHCRIRFDNGMELRYYDPRRFGHFYVAESCDFANDLNIGPDPFIARPRRLEAALVGRKAPIKSLLLDQRILSGLGNIYVDETLFFAGIDPRTPGGRVGTSSAKVLTHARAVLRRAIACGGSTIRDYRKHDGSRGEFQQYHAVYGRDGDRCIECGTVIRKIVLSGRGTHFCPRCQG